MASKPRQHKDETNEQYLLRLVVWRDEVRLRDRARYQRERDRRIKYEVDRYRDDPEHRERVKQRSRERYDSPPDGQRCECCGVMPGDTSNGRRGLHQDHRHDNNAVRGWLCAKCNREVAVLDLRFTDPDRFAALRSWSDREAPVVPVKSVDPKRRRRVDPHPDLFKGQVTRG